MRNSRGEFWTSGTNEGYGCDLKHGWCGSNTLLTKDSPWRSGEPNNLLGERCIQMYFVNISQLVLVDLPCSTANNFICEVYEVAARLYLVKRGNQVKILLSDFFRLECPTAPQFVPAHAKKTFDANYLQIVYTLFEF